MLTIGAASSASVKAWSPLQCPAQVEPMKCGHNSGISSGSACLSWRH
jgi:hypothetical protein